MTKPPIPDGMKWCPACRAVLPVTSFSVSNKETGSLRAYCKACGSAKAKAYYNSLPPEKKAEINAISTARQAREPEKNRLRVARWRARKKAELTKESPRNDDDL